MCRAAWEFTGQEGFLPQRISGFNACGSLIRKRLKADINAKGGNTQNEAVGLCKPLTGDHFIVFFIAMFCFMIVLLCDALWFNVHTLIHT